MLTCLRDIATVLVAVAQTETTALAAGQLMRKHPAGSLVVVAALEKAMRWASPPTVTWC